MSSSESRRRNYREQVQTTHTLKLLFFLFFCLAKFMAKFHMKYMYDNRTPLQPEAKKNHRRGKMFPVMLKEKVFRFISIFGLTTHLPSGKFCFNTRWPQEMFPKTRHGTKLHYQQPVLCKHSSTVTKGHRGGYSLLSRERERRKIKANVVPLNVP